MPYEKNSYIINHVNIALSRKILKTTMLITVKTIPLIRLLHLLGCIKTYVIFSKNRNKKRLFLCFTIFLYKNNPFYGGLRLITTSSKKFFISYNALKRLNHVSKASNYILSTSRGLLTSREALDLGIGGLLLVAVN